MLLVAVAASSAVLAAAPTAAAFPGGAGAPGWPPAQSSPLQLNRDDDRARQTSAELRARRAAMVREGARAAAAEHRGARRGRTLAITGGAEQSRIAAAAWRGRALDVDRARVAAAERRSARR